MLCARCSVLWALRSRVSSGTNRQSINKQRTARTRSAYSLQISLCLVGCQAARLPLTHLPFRHHSCECCEWWSGGWRLVKEVTAPATLIFIIYVTHSPRILLVDCFAYTCSLWAQQPAYIRDCIPNICTLYIYIHT